MTSAVPYNRFRFLDRKEESRLAWRMKRGDLEARDRLIESQRALVRGLAVKVDRTRRHLEDLIQVGEMWLVRFLPRFNPKRGRLSTYAFRSILRHMKAHLNAHCQRAVARPLNRPKPPRHQALFDAVSGARGIPQGFDLADRPGTDPGTLEQIQALRQAIEELPPREQAVIKGRLEGMLLRDLGLLLGVTRERVRQIEFRARERLRSALQGSK